MGTVIGVLMFSAFVAFVLLIIVAIVKQFLYIGKPNEILIFSGRDHRLPNGQEVGYRYQIGGRTFMIPFLEEVSQMDLRIIPVNIRIQGAYSKGGIPLNVHAIANVKISSHPDKIRNAIERFQGRERNEIMRVAQETLEGNLRGVLAGLTPEEVNEDRLRFVEELAKDAEPDMRKLGLHLDTLKIQNVSDDRDYLDSLGRKRIAEILRDAEIAESNAMKTAEEIEAREQGRSEVARRNAQANIQRAQNELRQIIADLDLQAKSEEEKSLARGMAARAESEQELQKVRTDLEAIRLQADVVIPADAQKVARELTAAGEAAEIAEKGRAMAEVLKMMSDLWVEAGDAALDVFIIQRIEEIMTQVAAAARQVHVRNVALIDSGDGATLPNYVSSFPRIVGSIFRELRDTAGIDVSAALTGKHLDALKSAGVLTEDDLTPGQAPRRSLDSQRAAALEQDPQQRQAQTSQMAAIPSAGQTTESARPPFAAFGRTPRADSDKG